MSRPRRTRSIFLASTRVSWPASRTRYQWRAATGKFGADYFLAFASVSNSVVPYEDIFKSSACAAPPPLARRTPTIRARRRGGAPPDRRGALRRQRLGRDLQSFVSVDLAAVADAKKSLDALARQLSKDGAKAELWRSAARGSTRRRSSMSWPENDANQTMPHVDLAQLCERIAASDRFSAAARSSPRHRRRGRRSRRRRFPRIRPLARASSPAATAFYVVFPEGDTCKTTDGKTSLPRP